VAEHKRLSPFADGDVARDASFLPDVDKKQKQFVTADKGSVTISYGDDVTALLG
jgi:hypothetical protein